MSLTKDSLEKVCKAMDRLCTSLTECYSTVQIFASAVLCRESTRFVTYGTGNMFARTEHAVRWFDRPLAEIQKEDALESPEKEWIKSEVAKIGELGYTDAIQILCSRTNGELHLASFGEGSLLARVGQVRDWVLCSEDRPVELSEEEDSD